MTRRVRLSREQVELARITVEADRLAGRATNPLIARIATIDGAPITVTAAEVRSFVRKGDTAPHQESVSTAS